MNNNYELINSFKDQIINCKFLHYDKVKNINVFSIFCVKNNIEYVKKDNIDISNNILESNKLIKFIINNNKQNNITFELKGLYKYCLNINYDDILNDNSTSNYYSKIDIFNDVYFEDTITYFNNLNSIYIFYNSKYCSNANSFKTRKKISYFNKTRKLEN